MIRIDKIQMNKLINNSNNYIKTNNINKMFNEKNTLQGNPKSKKLFKSHYYFKLANSFYNLFKMPIISQISFYPIIFKIYFYHKVETKN